MFGTKSKASITILVAAIATFYQLYLKHFLAVAGIYPERKIEAIGNEGCEVVKGLEACEKVVVHQPTGVLYLACSEIKARRLWAPYFDFLNPAGSGSDYIAQYDPKTGQITRMKLVGLEPNEYSAHGMDVVVSSLNPDDIWVYVVNHRKPKKGDPKKVGADSVIQVFKGTSPAVPGKASKRLVWVKTYNSKYLQTPNDVVGSADGKSFYWTNDHGNKLGFLKSLETLFQRRVTSVGYCHEKTGCKLAATDLIAANGITSNGNGTFYVVSSHGWVQVTEAQKDHTLMLGEKIVTGIVMDNLALDADGALYAAGLPKVLPFFRVVYGADVNEVKPPSMGIKITKNTGYDSYMGQKYKVETAFQNDGSLMTTSTSVAVDSERKLMYLHGIIAPHLLVCKL